MYFASICFLSSLGKTRTPAFAFGEKNDEHILIFRYGELLSGVLDKASIGNSSLGIVHAVYELYGSQLAGRLLTAFGRLFTYHLQEVGHTCGIEDLVLTAAADKERKKLLEKVEYDAGQGLKAFLDGKTIADAVAADGGALSSVDILSNEQKMSILLNSDRKTGKIKIDGAMQSIVNKSASDVIKICLPNGLGTLFPKNNFSMMVLTGAKGSAVNQSQISCFLGQQALEGQRVPLMISGKSLPSFKAYDTSARAGGFVRDRFLTGVKPQEYYFHCMAGREGLVDTAVKTSRSGYLQRCLVKHLEELRVHYDMTVRDSGGNVVQFFYGEDGLDTMSSSLLAGKREQLQFLARNHQAFVYKYSIYDKFLEQGFDVESAIIHHNMMEKAKFGNLSENLAGLNKNGHAKKSFVFVRTRRDSSLGWERNNLSKNWQTAQVAKVREKESSSSSYPSFTYDLLLSDGTKIKKVPKYICAVTARQKIPKESIVLRDTMIEIIKSGLPDPAMSLLRTDNSVGACSEKFQDALRSYIDTNPDGIYPSLSFFSVFRSFFSL